MMQMEPPEPTCPRCGEYIDEDDHKYCPCGAELDIDNSLDRYTLICPECGKLLEAHQVEWKCHKCGFDGKPRNCAGCNKPLSPKEDCLCENCRMIEAQQQDEEGLYHKHGGWWRADK